MGYNVEIEKSSLTIPASQKGNVLKAWKEMNSPANNYRKHGGSFSGGGKNEHWYSWMPVDYDQTVQSVEDVLDLLGFDYTILDNGDTLITGYCSKTGQEEEFFEEVRQYIHGSVSWIGEEGDLFKWYYPQTLDHGTIIEGEVVTKQIGHDKKCLTKV
jgi:hypothetical protein